MRRKKQAHFEGVAQIIIFFPFADAAQRRAYITNVFFHVFVN